MDEITKQLSELINRKGFQSLRDYNPGDESQQLMALGIMVSVFCQWDGASIMEVFAEALEDSNFHGECAQVRNWLEQMRV